MQLGVEIGVGGVASGALRSWFDDSRNAPERATERVEYAIRLPGKADDAAPCLSLVLLDLNLPKKPGIEVLEHLRRTRKCGNSLVVVVSSSDSIKDRAEAASMGADAYFRKPSGYEAYIKIGEIVKDLLMVEQPPGPWTPDAESE